jgi:hypothetical protein
MRVAMSDKIAELFGVYHSAKINWKRIASGQHCPFLQRKCVKVRKSRPEISIGTCCARYGREQNPVIICPYRFLENRQVFLDSIHLLTLHEPGNELHVVPEVSIPGGSVDYFLASVRRGRIEDFAGIELQTLDTTGTLWPERQRFLIAKRVVVSDKDASSPKTFGMNWKMTAKTILVQLHHKVQTFEHVNKHLILAIQDRLADYIRLEFNFAHIGAARLGDPMHLHSYRLNEGKEGLTIELAARFSTDSDGIAKGLGLRTEAKVELEAIIKQLEQRISGKTLLKLGVLPAAKTDPKD